MLIVYDAVLLLCEIAKTGPGYAVMQLMKEPVGKESILNPEM